MKNVFLTGDAAGFADPIFTEGISNSILSGKLAAEAIIKSNLDSNLAEKLYIEKLEEEILPQLRIGRIASKFIYKHKMLRNVLAKKFGVYLTDKLADVFHG